MFDPSVNREVVAESSHAVSVVVDLRQIILRQIVFPTALNSGRDYGTQLTEIDLQ